MFGSKWSRDDRWSSVRQETSEAIQKAIGALHTLSEYLQESGKANPTKAATGTASAVATSAHGSGHQVENTNQQVIPASTASNQQHSQQGDDSTTESSRSSTSQSPETEDGSALTNVSPSGSHRNGNSGGFGTETSGARPTEQTSEGVTPPQAEAEVTVGKSFTSAPKVSAKTGGSYGSAGNFGRHHNQGGEQEKRGQAKTPYEGDNSTVTIGSAAGGVALLGGGGAALYFLKVGGIKTLITGVP
ncbi:uncharacterized protein BcabD6B2_01550 [Babesia caballi]|uniref:Uncharacterized protein n=1 Tax=Babesia caballi TaxID=5871 RepID=A0AAV4LMS9_BABCB|nr:hypothetical protein BcabD6B2_01550 [Babesia caballi]